MAQSLEFYTLDSWLATKHKNLFIINSFTSTGEVTDCISEFTNINLVYDYIVKRFKEKSENIKARKLKITVEEEKILHITQITTYESYISHKIYKIYSTADNINKLKKLIYDTNFKDYDKKN